MKYHFGAGFGRLVPYLLLFPGVFFYLFIVLGPSIATFGYSFTDATGIINTDPIQWIGLDNYDEFLFQGAAAKDNLDHVRRTLEFSFWVTSIQFVLGLVLAMILNQGLIGTRFFRTLFFMPVMLGVVVQGLLWKLFLNPLDGPGIEFLDTLGFYSETFFGQPREAFYWVIFVQIWANVGITMVIFLAGLQTIPNELMEAAEIDGANGWQRFRNVTWPLLTPSVNTNLILNIIGSLQAWQLFWVLTGYKNGTQVLGYVVYAEGFGATGEISAPARQGYAAAASIVMFFFVMLFGLSSNYLLNRRERKILGE